MLKIDDFKCGAKIIKNCFRYVPLVIKRNEISLILKKKKKKENFRPNKVSLTSFYLVLSFITNIIYIDIQTNIRISMVLNNSLLKCILHV